MLCNILHFYLGHYVKTTSFYCVMVEAEMTSTVAVRTFTSDRVTLLHHLEESCSQKCLNLFTFNNRT